MVPQIWTQEHTLMFDCVYVWHLRFLSIMQTSMILIQAYLYQKVYYMAIMVICGQRVLEGSRPCG